MFSDQHENCVSLSEAREIIQKEQKEERQLLLALLEGWERDLNEGATGFRSPVNICWLLRPEVSRLILALKEGEPLGEVFKKEPGWSYPRSG